MAVISRRGGRGEGGGGGEKGGKWEEGEGGGGGGGEGEGEGGKEEGEDGIVAKHWGEAKCPITSGQDWLSLGSWSCSRKDWSIELTVDEAGKGFDSTALYLSAKVWVKLER